MIRLKRLNGTELVLNAELIETVESTPDTVVTLTNGKKIIVADPIDELIEEVITYRQLIHQPYLKLVNEHEAEDEEEE